MAIQHIKARAKFPDDWLEESRLYISHQPFMDQFQRPAYSPFERFLALDLDNGSFAVISNDAVGGVFRFQKIL